MVEGLRGKVARMSQQPSGWYDDPSNPEMLRYWDGVMWTSHTAPKKSPTLPESTATVPQQQPASPPTPQPTVPMPQGGAWQGQNAPQQQYPPTYPQYPAQYPPAPGAPGWTAMGPTTADGVPLASWGRRFGAWILDGIVIAIIGGFAAQFAAPDYFDSISDLFDAASRGATPEEVNAISQRLAGATIQFSVVFWLVATAYCVAFWTTTAQTLGKMALGISVRSEDRPGPLTVGTAILRRLVPLASQFVPLLNLLDGLWPLWDGKRQALHDKVAKTQVVVGKQPKRQS